MDLVCVLFVVVLCIGDNLLYNFPEDGCKKQPKHV
jgi:hypothetical protein